MTQQNTAQAAPGTPELPSGVVYSNYWTGFDSKEIGELFECIPLSELVKLKPGASIWIDTEMPSGKVYGLDHAVLESVREKGDDVIVRFAGEATSGGTTIRRDFRGDKQWHKVHRCTDEAKLIELIKQNPLAIEFGTVGTMSPKSRDYLRSIGARIVAA